MATKTKIQLENLQSVCKLIVRYFERIRMDDDLFWRAILNYKYILNHYKNKSLYDDKCRDYILNSFLEISSSTLMSREFEFGQQSVIFNTADEVKFCFISLTEIAVSLMQSNHPLGATILYHCMNSECSFYVLFGHDWRQRRGEELKQHEREDHEEWRENEIKIGSHVDYLMHNRWCYGEIKNISEKEDKGTRFRVLDIEPLMRGFQSTNVLQKFTLSAGTIYQICAPLTKSIQKIPHMLQWRKQLNMLKCNVLITDECNELIPCTVMETDPGSNRIRIKHDEHDDYEWIFRDDRSLREYNSNILDIENKFEDNEDPEDESIFAINRGKISAHSFHLVDVMNAFGKSGGFELILEKLAESMDNISLKSISLMLYTVSECFAVYTKSFSALFMQKAYTQLLIILNNMTSYHLNELNKKICSDIVVSICNLNYRYCSPQEIQQLSDSWTLELLLKRVHNMTGDAVEDLINFAFSGDRFESVFTEWIINNNIFGCLLGLTNVILCKSDVLFTGYMRQSIGYDIDIMLSKHLLHFITQWFDDYSNVHFINAATQIFHFMHTTDRFDVYYIDMILNTMISCLMREENHFEMLLEAQTLCVSVWDAVGSVLMGKMVKKLTQHCCVLETIQMVQRMITLMRCIRNMDSNLIFAHMCDNEKLMECFYEDIIYFKKYVTNIVETQQFNEAQINDIKLFQSQRSYLEHVQVRIAFLKFITENYNDSEAKKSVITILRGQFMENALSEREREEATKLHHQLVQQN